MGTPYFLLGTVEASGMKILISVISACGLCNRLGPLLTAAVDLGSSVSRFFGGITAVFHPEKDTPC